MVPRIPIPPLGKPAAAVLLLPVVVLRPHHHLQLLRLRLLLLLLLALRLRLSLSHPDSLLLLPLLLLFLLYRRVLSAGCSRYAPCSTSHHCMSTDVNRDAHGFRL